MYSRYMNARQMNACRLMLMLALSTHCLLLISLKHSLLIAHFSTLPMLIVYFLHS
jgi:hypothetical protein